MANSATRNEILADADSYDSYVVAAVLEGIAGVATFKKDRKKIDVVRSASQSALFPLTHFWSTLQMNWVSASRFCCPYPDLTFEKRGVLNGLVSDSHGRLYDFVLPLLFKYRARGFRIGARWETFSGGQCAGSHNHVLCPALYRSFHDAYCLGGSFGPHGFVRGIGSVRAPFLSDWRVGWWLGGLHGTLRAKHGTRVWSNENGQRERRSGTATRYNIASGIDIPHLAPYLDSEGRIVNFVEVSVSPRDRFVVFFTSRPVISLPNRALCRVSRETIWRGELLVFRRGTVNGRLVNMRRNDDLRALIAVQRGMADGLPYYLLPTMMHITMSPELREHAVVKLVQSANIAAFMLASDHERVKLASRWDIITIAGLAGLGPEGSTAALQLIGHRWNTFLDEFIGDTTSSFLRVLSDCRSVIANEAALRFLQPRQHARVKTVEIYCPKDQYETVCIFLIDRLAGRTLLERRLIELPNGTSFDVMRGATFSAFGAIPSLWSTHLMNFISLDAICVTYPWALDNKYGVIDDTMTSPDVRDGIRMYEDEGYVFAPKFSRVDDTQCAIHGECPRTLRHFGDNHCLTIRFNRGRNRFSQLPHTWPDDGIIPPTIACTTAWILGGDPCMVGSCTVHHMAERSANGNGIAELSDAPTIPASLKADIALLRSLLQNDALTGDPENADEPGLEELLQRLETADGIARGVESRLDDIIDHLDELLEGLEPHSGELGRIQEQTAVVAEEITLVEEERSISGHGTSVQVSEMVSVTETRK
ncbi:hypothetical protein NM688_g8447 [Phlebia brevispora]|uniref:Uncharacterized protein n=1 Tax=Phlebia brevispora TaxID=194682 RepID=A0ACC1RRA2_9APHY|nr:hypothetical protein NM688_g8447 [Phlebia brevispora]